MTIESIKVKPLEWNGDHGRAVMGAYRVSYNVSGQPWGSPELGAGYYAERDIGFGQLVSGGHETRKAAEQAADGDYDSRVLSALSHSPVEQESGTGADFDALASELDIDWVAGLFGSRYGSGAEFLADVAKRLRTAPIKYRNEETGFVEFINRDCPYIVRELPSPSAVLLDMETRDVIGYRVYDPDSIAHTFHIDAVSRESVRDEVEGTPSPSSHMTGDDVEPRSRMQLSPGYLNSFETVISALKSGGKQAQDAGHIAHGACLLHAAVELEAILSERATPPQYHLQSFQDRVAIAHHALFHDDPTDVAERVARFFEEAAETCQALGMTHYDADKLLSYTFSRPVGDPAKEIGAAKLTLASLCVVAGYDMDACGEADLEKLQRPETIARIRAKRLTRHGRGPLPGFDPALAAEGQADG